MTWQIVHRVVAALVFILSLLLYLATVAPTASFWDCGEFIAVAHGLQISHPPGSPFFMLTGRLFTMFAAPENVAYSMNVMSVVSTALTVLLTHLVLVQLARYWMGPRDTWTPFQRLTVLAGGFIGAMTFAATDSLWFNAVEAEVYAMSMLFTALVVWAILHWAEVAEAEEASFRDGKSHPFTLQANRYLVLIAYLFGLAIGVHLLNLLALFFVALIFYFTEYDKPEHTLAQRLKGILYTGLVSSAVFLTIYPGVIQTLPDIAGQSGSPLLFLFAVAVIVMAAVWYTQVKGMPRLNLVAVSLMLVLVGYSTYALIFIRSAANPPIDQNDPSTSEAIVSYLKREQYGATPILFGPVYENSLGRIGDREKVFPRRWSPEPSHMRVYDQYSSDMDFFFRYQIGHMYMRYFLWQFAGRDSDVQGAPSITGIPLYDNRIPNRAVAFQTPSEHASRNRYFALPLFLGLFGMVYHFRKDPRRAFSIATLFFVSGIGIILYLNQTPLQPRERDYSYVASFFAFALWIGIGAMAMLEAIGQRLQSTKAALPAGIAAAAVLTAAVPAWMTYENYDDHDRSGNYVAPDYAYNMLMSVAENAILFTNGDNDTFPLWYLQEVEGVRTDVRVANLSLLQTPWYIYQLRDRQTGLSAPLPISFTDEAVDAITAVQYQPREFTLPVNRDNLVRFGAIAPSDTALVESPMRWAVQGRNFGEIQALFPNDIALIDLLNNVARQGWERPYYFAVTVSPDGQVDLQPFFQLEGQAMRVVPIRHEEPLGRVVPDITLERMMQFRFRGLTNPRLYLDENARRLLDNYRSVYAVVAEAAAAQGRKQEAIALLDTLNAQMPFEIVAADPRTYNFMIRAYLNAGAEDRAREIMDKAEPYTFTLLRESTGRTQEMAFSLTQLLRLARVAIGDFDAASRISNQVAALMGRPDFAIPDTASMASEQDSAREFLGLEPLP